MCAITLPPISIGSLASVFFHRGVKERYVVMLSIDNIFFTTLDESADQKRERVFVAVAVGQRVPSWGDVEKQWMDRIGRDNIKYFSSTECRALEGEFRKFKTNAYPPPTGREAATKIRSDLETIFLSSHLIGFATAIHMPEYLEVIKQYRAARIFFETDPHVYAYYSLMHQVTRVVRRKAKDCAVAFIYDESTYSEKVRDAFRALKQTHPVVSQSMATFAPLDDKVTPALQVADLVAHKIKDAVEQWFSRGGSHYIQLSKEWRQHIDFVGKVDRDYMLNCIYRTVASKRFTRGLLPVRKVKIRRTNRK